MPGKPEMLQFMGSQRVGHNLATEQQQRGPALYLLRPCREREHRLSESRSMPTSLFLELGKMLPCQSFNFLTLFPHRSAEITDGDRELRPISKGVPSLPAPRGWSWRGLWSDLHCEELAELPEVRPTEVHVPSYT